MAPHFRVCGILGAMDIDDDDWMFRNFVLYHELSRHLQGEWMGCIPLEVNRPYFHLHGPPAAQRIVLGSEEEDYTWYTLYTCSELKRQALRKLETLCRMGESGDRLIIFLTGHGDYQIDKGSVYVGNNLLRPEDLYRNRAVLRSKADITLIVDACYSGVWLTKSAGVRFRSTFEIVCGADNNDTTLSWPQSGSNRRRGEIFANFIASSVYGEYDLHFARSQVLNDNGDLEDRFPETNLNTINEDFTLMRRHYIRLHDMVRDMCASMLKLSPAYPLPKHGTRGRVSAPVDGLTALGLSEGRGFRHTLNQLTDANPPTNAGIQNAGGTMDAMISAYISGPHYPAEFATEPRISNGIRKYRMLGHNDNLRRTLEGRLNVLMKAQQFAKDHGVVLPEHWRPLDGKEKKYLEENHKVLSAYCFSERGTSSWILPAQLLAIALVEGGKPPLVAHATRVPDDGGRSLGARIKRMMHRARGGVGL